MIVTPASVHNGTTGMAVTTGPVFVGNRELGK